MPDEKIDLPFVTSGLDGLERQTDRAARSVERLGKKVQAVQGPYQRLARIASQYPAARASGDRNAVLDLQYQAARLRRQIERAQPRTPKPPSVPRFVTGPHQQIAALTAQRSAAEEIGNTSAVKDIDLALARAQKRLTPKEPPSFGQRLNTLVRSTRFGVGKEGGGAMPLVGKALDLFGGGRAAGLLGGAAGGAEAGVLGAEAAGGPVGWVLAALTVAASGAIKVAEALKDVAESASEASRSFQSLKFMTGGTGAETGRMAALARAAGLSPDTMAGLSGGLQERISGDPLAMAAGQRLGVFNLPRPFGNTDEAGQFLRVIDRLRAESEQDRIRDARMLGLDGLAGLFNVSNRQFGLAGRDAGTQAQIFNPRFAQQAADFMASLGRVGDSLQNLMAAVSPVFIDTFTDFFNSLASTINDVALSLSQHKAQVLEFLDVVQAIGDAFMGDAAGAAAHIANITGGKDARLALALDANTSATQTNTQALGYGVPGTYGVTDRANPIGDGMGGEALRRGLEAGGYRMGMYG